MLQGAEATLLCPDETGDVTWRRFINGKLVALVTVTNGVETMEDKRYGSRGKTSLVIRDVTSFDSSMYFCNHKKVYLTVTKDPSEVGPDAGREGATPANAGPGTAGDAGNRPPSGRWKGPVGMVAGAALVILGVLTLNFCHQKRTEKTTRLHKTEAIYEEIDVGRQSRSERPHHFASVGEMANQLPARGRVWRECVYSLAQSPPSTGSVGGEDGVPVGGLSHCNLIVIETAPSL